MAQKFMIGKIAILAGVHIETIRYYQRRGLLSEPEKPHRRYGRYPRDIVQHIRFIKRAQALGFTLNEIAVLMKMEEAALVA
jgi:MerR family mercuric resistance operon transcriptional regulator